jgi:hypothetical protein
VEDVRLDPHEGGGIRKRLQGARTVDVVCANGKCGRGKDEGRFGHGDRTGLEMVSPPKQERAYLDMPVEAGA